MTRVGLRGAMLLALLWAAPGHAKTVVCPGPTILPGIDVSYWQGTIDWPKVKASGKKYAIIRAAHGLAADTKFAFNWKQCHAQGLHCGAYLYFEPNLDVLAQAKLLVSTMGKLAPGDLPPVIDVESKGGKTPAQVAAAVGTCIDYVQTATGRKPIIYTGAYFWEDNVKSTAFVDHPLWHAQYCTNCCPNIAHPWKKWHFWQHSSTGSVSGISGNVDLDKWNGTAADLAKFAQVVACTPKCDGTSVVKADCSKTDCATAAGTCVADSLGVRCISKHCPAQGKKLVCPPSTGNALLGSCQDGKLSTSDCSAASGFCSTAAASTAKCVSSYCAASPTSKPVVQDVCLPDGIRYACASNGDLNVKPCPAGAQCKTVAGAAQCVVPTCKPHCQGGTLVGADCKETACNGLPAPYTGWCIDDAKGPRCVANGCKTTGIQTFCLPGGAQAKLGVCQGGVLTVQACVAGQQVCAATASGAACAATACVADPKKPVAAHDLCLTPTALTHCDAQGQASVQPCPAGQKCVPGVLPAVCVGPLDPPDTQGADAGPGADADPGADAASGAADGVDPDTGASEADGDTLVDGAGPQDVSAGGGDGQDPLARPDGGADAQPVLMSSAAPSSGCDAGPGSAPAAVWLLAVVAWVLRRRRGVSPERP